MTELLHIIAEPNRQHILRRLWDREQSAGEIAANFEVTFSAVSQHLKVRRDAGLVEQRRDGERLLHKADRERLGPLAAYLEQLWTGHLGRLKSLAQSEEWTKTRKAKSNATRARKPTR